MRMRTGRVTQEDLDLINTRVVGSVHPANGSVVAACAHLTERVAVVVNNTRRLLNSQGLSTWLTYAAPRLPDATAPPLPIMLRGKYTKKAQETIAQSLLQTLPTLADTVFSGRIGNLLLALNAPIVVGDVIKYTPTTDGDAVLGLGNGTTGTVYGMQFPPGTTFEVKYDVHGVAVYVEPSRTIQYLLLKIDNPKFPPFTGLPDGVYPLAPSSAQGKQKCINLYLHQVPVTLRFSTTIHKLQGVTADYLTVGEMRTYGTPSPGNSVWHPSMLYVLLSRVRTLAGLHLLRPLTMTDMEDFYSILPGYNAEMARLETFVQASIQDFPHPCTLAPNFSTNGPVAPHTNVHTMPPTPSPAVSTNGRRTTFGCAPTSTLESSSNVGGPVAAQANESTTQPTNSSASMRRVFGAPTTSLVSSTNAAAMTTSVNPEVSKLGSQ